MEISLKINKSIEENASAYFDKAKLYKKKAEGAKVALANTKEKLKNLEKDIEKRQLEEKERSERKVIKREWYEKFRWFRSSEGFLVIGGRDATTNEVIIKKHTDNDDIVFHSELPGSPFVVIKCEGKKPGDATLEEAAVFTGVYSKAWKSGWTTSDVFYVNPEQVSKEAPSGEYMGKGSFMIYGKKEMMHPVLKLFVGRTEEGKIMAGPKDAVKSHCERSVELTLGNEKSSSIAKKIKSKLETYDLDEIIRVIPVGSKMVS